MKVICVPHKTVSVEQRGELKEAGFIVIEIDDPSKVVVIDELQILSGDDLAFCSIAGLVKAQHREGNIEFTKQLFNKLSLKSKIT